MTDVPPDERGAPPPSPAPGPAYPPPPSAPPAFDDDALAAALEQSMSPYTQPIAVVPPAPAAEPAPAAPAPPAAEPVAAPPAPAPPAASPVPPAAQSPAYESDYQAPDVPEYVVPPAPPAPEYEVPPAPPAPPYEPPPAPVFDQPVYDVPVEQPSAPRGPGTLDAIERLEEELRRQTGEVPTPPAAPVAPAEPVWEPALDHPAPGHVFPSAYQPFTNPVDVAPPAPPAAPAAPEAPPAAPAPPAAAPEAPPAAPAASADWLAAPPPAPEAPEPPSAPTPPPLVEPTGFGQAPAAPAAPTPPPASAPPVAPPPTDGATYVAPTVLPPIREVRLEDVQGLPPPIGQQAAPLPPYDPNVPVMQAGTVPVAPTPPAAPTAPAGPPPVSPDAFGGAYGTPVPGPLPGSADLPSLDDLDPIDRGDENDDAVDDIDRVFGGSADDAFATAGFAGAAGAATASAAGPYPSQPISTQSVSAAQPGLVDQRPENHPVFVVESAGVEPTALDLRAGRAARLFWLWFAANSSVVSLAIGAVLFSLGMSLRQTIVATLAGVALSFLPLGLGTLAGKWSGQPTMVVSRATFGHVGNILPAVLAVLTRVFWGAVLLWLLGVSTAQLLVFAGLDAGLGESVWTFVVLGAGAVVAVAIALFGYGFVARLQLVLSILTGLLVAGLIYMTYPQLDIDAALAVGDGAWTLVIGGAVVVFSFVGLAWVQSSSDVARYQRTASSGAQSMLWASLGATLPPFVLIVWGAMLAASDPTVATGLASSPLPTIARMLPLWYPAPLLAAAGLGLISSIVLAIYSGGFALQSLGIRARRSITTLVSGLLIAVLALGLVVLAADAFSIARDLATTLAVPVAAWAGIFAAEMMIRTRRFDSPSLLAPGGVYPQVRVANLIGFVLITGIGFGLSTATFPGLTWQGFFFPLLGIAAEDPFATSDIGVVVALLLGIVVPLATAIPAIRRQERDSLKAEHTGPIPRITGAIPRVDEPAPRLEP